MSDPKGTSDPKGAKPGAKPGSSPIGEEKKKKTSPVKKWAIVVGVFLVSIAIAFGAGWFLGSSGIEELERQAESATRQARLLEARRRLDLTHVELENRNFGHAESHLRAAAQKLNAFAEEDGRMGQLARDVAETQIGNTSDMAAQKQKIRAFISRFDQILQPGSGPSATTAGEEE